MGKGGKDRAASFRQGLKRSPRLEGETPVEPGCSSLEPRVSLMATCFLCPFPPQCLVILTFAFFGRRRNSFTPLGKLYHALRRSLTLNSST